MKLISGLFAISFLLSACSAKISGGSDASPTPDAKPFVDEISGGPDISGHWKSSCTDTNFAGGQYPKQKIDMVVSGHDVTRDSQQYSDSACQVPGPQTSQHGKYRYVLNKGADTYEVEYQFDSGHGFSYRNGENIRLSGSTLYTSNMVSGDADASTPLYAARAQGSRE